MQRYKCFANNYRGDISLTSKLPRNQCPLPSYWCYFRTRQPINQRWTWRGAERIISFEGPRHKIILIHCRSPFPRWPRWVMSLGCPCPNVVPSPSNRADLCNQQGICRDNGVWLSGLGHKRFCGFYLVLFLRSVGPGKTSCHNVRHLSGPMERYKNGKGLRPLAARTDSLST